MALMMACREMNSASFQCREEDDYRKSMTVSLGEVSRRPEVPSVIADDLFGFPEDFSQVYLVFNQAYWLVEIHLEARVRERQHLLAGWHNVERFGMRTSERPSSYCLHPD